MRTNISYLEEMAAGNTDLMLEMIEIFSEQVNDIRKKMLELLDQREWLKLGKLAHKGKGTVSIVGMEELAAEMKRFELLTKDEKDVDTYPGLVERFITETREAEEELIEIAKNLK